MNKYLQGIHFNIFFSKQFPFSFHFTISSLFSFLLKKNIYVPFECIINESRLLCTKSICFLKQLQGLKIIMNSLSASELGLVSESEF